MLSKRFIRENPRLVEKACQDKQVDPAVVKKFLQADQEKKGLVQRIESLQARRNKLTGNKKPDKRTIGKVKELKEKIKALKPELREKKKEARKWLAEIPNLPAADVPKGKDESENKVIKKWGDVFKPSFKGRDHLRLGEDLGLINVKRAAKVSGTRFGYLLNEAVLLEFALINYGLEKLTKEGFIPVLPPVLTKVSVFKKLGYCQQGGNKEYYLVYDPKKENPQERANYYLVGTAEHALVPMHKDEVFSADSLPRRYVGFSPAFRREAGSWGKDTRGIFRVHQFDKLEMVAFIKPQSNGDKKEHRYLLSLAEKLVQDLSLPYQVVKMCTGDLGQPAARKYDLECWFPSEKKYRETHSLSTCTDYQSRALKIKYQKDKNRLGLVHILNGTAFAVGRIMLAILENYQQEDGSIKVPSVLQPYLKKKIIKPKN